MIDLRPDLLAIVQEVLQRLVPACEVRAFGSRQKWTAKETSDLDLVVVGSQRLPLKTMAALKEAFEESILPMRVDVLDWNAISEEFRRVIEVGFEVIQGGEASLAPASSPAAAGASAPPLSGGCVGFTSTIVRDIVARSKNALVGGPFGSDLVSKDYVEFGVPVIRGQNMGSGRWVSGDFAFVSKDKASALSANTAQANDLIFTQRGTLGQVALVPDDGFERYVISQSQMKLTPDPDKADSLFLYYLFCSPEQQEYIRNSAIQTGVPHTNLGILRNTPISLPPLPIQKAIAHILGALDDRIELCRRMNETLEAMAHALFKDWFIDFGPVRAKMEGREPPGLAPEIAALFPFKLVDSELGEIPEGWEISTIGEEVRAVGGGTPSTKEPEFWDNGCHFWATPKDLSKLQFPVILETERKITDAGLAKISSGLLPVGTLLLSSRAPIGYMAITEVPLAINQGFIAMICDMRISNIFAYFWCKENMDRIIGNANGSTFQEISKSNFRPLPMLIPSKGILAAFSAATHDIHQKLVTNQIQANLLSKTRDNLLPKLLSGALSLEGVELA